MLEQREHPLLQVALDFTNIEKAIRVMSALRDLPIPVVEVGTPLIKAEGVRSIAIIKALASDDTLILADMKTADVGALETSMAALHGADIVTVLASSDDAVIEAAVTEGRKLGVDIIADTIGLQPDVIPQRVKELRKLGVNIINIHSGIDVQRRLGIRATSFQDLACRVKSDLSDVIISISGGIKPEDIRKFAGACIDIVVIGSAITKAPDPRGAATRALDALSRIIRK